MRANGLGAPETSVNLTAPRPGRRRDAGSTTLLRQKLNQSGANG